MATSASESSAPDDRRWSMRIRFSHLRSSILMVAIAIPSNRCAAWCSQRSVHRTGPSLLLSTCRWKRQCYRGYSRVISHPLILKSSSVDDNYDGPVSNTNGSFEGTQTSETATNSSQQRDGSVDTNTEEGILLDPETYLRAESLLQPDGSLTLDSPSIPSSRIKNQLYRSAVGGLFSPASYYYPENDNDDPTANDGSTPGPSRKLQSEDEILLQAMSSIGTFVPIDAEVLHQQVFAEEQVYLQQSDEFRKSLTTLYGDDEKESPMARERREATEKYNDEVLEKLMKEMDDMEDWAPSREEAILRAKNVSISNTPYCSRCGLRLTPEVMALYRRTEEDGIDVTTQRFSEMQCLACYGSRLGTTKEAEVRHGSAPYGGGSGWKPWDKGMRPRSIDKRGRKGDGIVDASSMFRIPNDFNGKQASSDNVMSSSSRFNTKVETRLKRPSRELGGMELSKRKLLRESEGGWSAVEDRATEQPSFVEAPTATSTNHETEPVDSSSGNINRGLVTPTAETEALKSSQGDERWVTVTDPRTKRKFYWNKSTGEMMKNAPD